MKYKLIIEGDENDADYIHTINEVDQETVDSFLPILDAIKNCKAYHNWCGEYDDVPLEELYSQFVTDWEEHEDGDRFPIFTEAFEAFIEIVPNVHSIKSVILYKIVEEIRLL